VAATLKAGLEGRTARSDVLLGNHGRAKAEKSVGRLEELAEIISLVGDRAEIGICLDSAHLFAAGLGHAHQGPA